MAVEPAPGRDKENPENGTLNPPAQVPSKSSLVKVSPAVAALNAAALSVNVIAPTGETIEYPSATLTTIAWIIDSLNFFNSKGPR